MQNQNMKQFETTQIIFNNIHRSAQHVTLIDQIPKVYSITNIRENAFGNSRY